MAHLYKLFEFVRAPSGKFGPPAPNRLSPYGPWRAKGAEPP
jgi:hypothetical protein